MSRLVQKYGKLSKILPSCCSHIIFYFSKGISDDKFAAFLKFITELQKSLSKDLLHMIIAQRLDEVSVGIYGQVKHFPNTDIKGVFKMLSFNTEEVPELAASV